MIDLGRGLPIGLSGLAVGLFLVIKLEVADWRQGDASPALVQLKVDQSPAAAAAPGMPNQHAAWLTEIMARPLFNPDRHPVDLGMRGLPRLTGIIVAGTQRVAIFAGPADGRPLVAQVGGHVGAYEVRAVADEGVTVVGPEGISMIRPVFATRKPARSEARAANLLSTKPNAKAQ
jgi:hypothetical protein